MTFFSLAVNSNTISAILVKLPFIVSGNVLGSKIIEIIP